MTVKVVPTKMIKQGQIQVNKRSMGILEKALAVQGNKVVKGHEMIIVIKRTHKYREGIHPSIKDEQGYSSFIFLYYISFSIHVLYLKRKRDGTRVSTGPGVSRLLPQRIHIHICERIPRHGRLLADTH